MCGVIDDLDQCFVRYAANNNLPALGAREHNFAFSCFEPQPSVQPAVHWTRTPPPRRAPAIHPRFALATPPTPLSVSLPFFGGHKSKLTTCPSIHDPTPRNTAPPPKPYHKQASMPAAAPPPRRCRRPPASSSLWSYCLLVGLALLACTQVLVRCVVPCPLCFVSSAGVRVRLRRCL